MRRSEKKILDTALIESILQEAIVCRLGLCVDNEPYVVPMNFAYRENAIYLHAAPEGKKIGMIKTNPFVCFEVDHMTEVVTSENACNWGMRYYSIIGFGEAFLIDDKKAKSDALNIIMGKYSGLNDQMYSGKSLENITVIRVEISEMTGKKSGY
ncbi:MAG: pyridoxamine 5'-phosphate oxidase family protein [Methanolobus sp.]|nr:pyridoxamine 5'-phosphate oxidase family protein [Methanolobus sp.]